MPQLFKLLFAFFFLYPSFSGAQPFSWAKTAQGKGARTGSAMAVDANRNIYVSGPLQDTAYFDSLSIYGKGSFLVKYNKNAAVLWAKAFPGLRCRAISADIMDFVYLTGTFRDSVLVDTVKLKSTGALDFFLIKLDSTGKLIWAKQGDGPGNDIAYAIANDYAGNTCIAGSFENYVNFDAQNSLLSLGKTDIFIAQYDSNGTVQWLNKAGGTDDDAGTSLAADLQGNFYLTGYFRNTATFYKKTFSSAGGSDIFITKYNSLGYQLYVQTGGGPGDDYPAALTVDAAPNIYLSGTFDTQAEFDGRELSGQAKDAFLAQYAGNGAIKWVLKIGGEGDDEATGVSVDGASNSFITGVFSDSVSFGSDKLTGRGGTDIFIAKFDILGRLLWATDAGGTGADSSGCIYTDHDDAAFITGNYGDGIDFGGISLTGANHFFVAKLKPDPTGIISPRVALQRLQAWPNPSGGRFYLQHPQNTGTVEQMTVYDATGRKVPVVARYLGATIMVNLEEMPEGIYLVKIKTLNGYYSARLIKE